MSDGEGSIDSSKSKNDSRKPGKIDFGLSHRLTRRHDLAFLRFITETGDQESVLLSEQAHHWLLQQGLHPLDIISKLHLLVEREKDAQKRYFGFQFRGQSMAFVIAYIDQYAWENGIYRERMSGENCRLVKRTLHMFMFDEIYSAKEQRHKMMRLQVPQAEVAAL